MLTLEERLNAKLDKSGNCWLWTGGHLPTGYGMIKVEGKHRGTHRVMWEIVNGPIPAGLLVCHKCDTPACCNPAHLFLGTYFDNAWDSIDKGRYRAAGRPRKPRVNP